MQRFQFSLRAQMIAVTAIAVVLGLSVLLGTVVIYTLFVGVMYCLVPTPLVIAAIFAQGDLRAFLIGALIPWIILGRYPVFPLTPIASMSTVQLFGHMVLSTVLLLFAAALCGALAMATRRWIKGYGGD
jgi:hypothetical protein